MRDPDEELTRPAAPVASVLRIMAIAAAAILLVWLLSDVLLLIFLAILLAVILRGISDWAARHTGLPERAMLAIVAILGTVLALGFCYYIGPRLIQQAQDLWTQLHQQMQQLRQAYGDTPWGHAIFQQLSPSGSVENHITSSAATVASSAIGSVTLAFILIVTSLYFAISPDLYVSGTVRLFPLRHRPRARQVMLDIGSTLQWWSLGQLIDMVVVGVLSGVGLAILGVPLALALGVLAGVFTFVPYFGAIAAAVPAVLVALTVSWQTALWVLVIYLICHGVEGYVVAPLVQRRTVDLPPALTILSMTILGTLFGALGVILGTPLAAVALVAVREAYVGDVLGDPST